MSLIQVDVKKCKRDGICAAVCPVELIRLEGQGFPKEIAEADQRCMSCGHCVAACPEAALSHSRVSVCLPFHEDKRVNAESLEQFLKMRRSIREFKPAPVPREILAHVIDTARWAPSAINIQPVRWLVVQKPEKTRTLAGLIADWIRVSNASYLQRFIEAWDQGRDLILRGAPHVIIAHASPENIWSPVDCAIAVTYLELAAQAGGLGTCWSGLLVRAAEHNREIAEFLGLPPQQKIFGAAMIGYPKFRYHRIPEKNKAVIDWL